MKIITNSASLLTREEGAQLGITVIPVSVSLKNRSLRDYIDISPDEYVGKTIRMDGVLTPIVINLWYNCCDPDRYTEYVWSREHLPVDDRTPHMGTFCFRNMVCTDAEAAACYIDGLPESPIEKVILENISVSFAENAEPHVPAMQNFAQERCKLGLYLDNVKEIEVRNVKMHGQVGEMLIADHYDRITTEGFEQV